ncbi:MAG: hypothetical protein IPO02_16025 [Bacteroidetes bacterium]|jgi:hypothetical protein|nr:hypothetical protein [Bacteroidota bacterium]
MKNQLFILSLFVACILCSFAPKSEFTKYISKEGRFSINFMGKPEESSQMEESADGIPFKVHFVQYTPDDYHVYMVGWTDMKDIFPKNVSIQKILENSRDGATASMKAKKVNTLKTHLGENPYIEFTFESDDFMGKDRIYLVNKIQYSVITLFKKADKLPRDAEEFINSFKLLP